ncbi:hypothetical protein BCR33DRAFT_770049 [Rhizoclosmatium globosum]|uniref:Uncharacterized protein n=1 Tax=Rhizoclosmatium globosum TaxID=329046 RepID=A0A1Y2BQ21_9FUNG|nr:hypothetical protein BCR33DRAFT_770049 [Rhizoclosmatium globosum]|eukprot:ORY36844.1 hypothetical protein BCR33DRAFT_770049 [Rhizoclosmatium globosum]
MIPSIMEQNVVAVTTSDSNMAIKKYLRLIQRIINDMSCPFHPPDEWTCAEKSHSTNNSWITFDDKSTLTFNSETKKTICDYDTDDIKPIGLKSLSSSSASKTASHIVTSEDTSILPTIKASTQPKPGFQAACLQSLTELFVPNFEFPTTAQEDLNSTVKFSDCVLSYQAKVNTTNRVDLEHCLTSGVEAVISNNLLADNENIVTLPEQAATAPFNDGLALTSGPVSILQSPIAETILSILEPACNAVEESSTPSSSPSMSGLFNNEVKTATVLFDEQQSSLASGSQLPANPFQSASTTPTIQHDVAEGFPLTLRQKIRRFFKFFTCGSTEDLN